MILAITSSLRDSFSSNASTFRSSRFSLAGLRLLCRTSAPFSNSSFCYR